MSNMKTLWEQAEEDSVPVDRPWTNTKVHPETAEAKPSVGPGCGDTMYGLHCVLKDEHLPPHMYMSEGRP